jgi:hypothetical protein
LYGEGRFGALSRSTALRLPGLEDLCHVEGDLGPDGVGERDEFAGGGTRWFLVCHYAETWGGCPLGDDLFGRGGKLLWCEPAVRTVGGAAAA